jgi:hypothetical protein
MYVHPSFEIIYNKFTNNGPGLSPKTTARRSTSTSSVVCNENPRRRPRDLATLRSRYLYADSLTYTLEGVLVAKKDFNLPKHGDIDTKNLFVIKALQSLDSRGFVKTQFSWQYYYYTLTPEVRFTLHNT